MDILEYINRMNRLYGTEPLAPWDKPEVPWWEEKHEPAPWDEAKAPPRYNTMRLLTGGRVEMKPGGIVEPGVTHYGKDDELVYDRETKKFRKAQIGGKPRQKITKKTIAELEKNLPEGLRIRKLKRPDGSLYYQYQASASIKERDGQSQGALVKRI